MPNRDRQTPVAAAAPGGGGDVGVHFSDDYQSGDNTEDDDRNAGVEAPHSSSATSFKRPGSTQQRLQHQQQQQQQQQRRLQRPHTAAAGAPFLDAHGNRTQPSRDVQQQHQQQGGEALAQTATKRKLRRKRRSRPKTAIGIEHPLQKTAGSSGSSGAAVTQGQQPQGGSEPNFPTLNPRMVHALRGFLTPESLRKTKIFAEREDKMLARRGQLDEQQKRLGERIGVFYQRLDNFITQTNAASQWEPEDKRKQKTLLDRLDQL